MAIGELLQNLKEWITPSKVKSDGYGSILFYKVTFAVCLFSFAVLFGLNFFGDPIDCKDIDDDDWCLWHGTRRILDNKILGDESSCKAEDSRYDIDANETLPLMVYYGYIPFLILLNGFIFQIPHTIWKILGGRTIKMFYSDQANEIYTESDEEKTILVENKNRFKRIQHSLRWYHAKYVFCQFLYIAALITICIVNHVVLQENFLDYGYNEQWNGPCTVFPTKTQCIHTFGGKGGPDSFINAICTLHYNNANQYIFLILWYWYIILFIAGIFQLVFEAVCIWVPAFRANILKKKLPSRRNTRTEKEENRQNTILEQFDQDQWFLLFQISRNMHPTFFCEFFTLISEEEADPMMTMNGADVA